MKITNTPITVWRTKSEDFSLVSSLYGPGTVLGFYLSVLAIAIYSFKKRDTTASSSFTSDLIALLIFPIFALAHILWLKRSLPKPHDPQGVGSETAMLQYFFNLQAPITLLKIYAGIGHNLLICFSSGKRMFWLEMVAHGFQLVGLFAALSPLNRTFKNSSAFSSMPDQLKNILALGDRELGSLQIAIGMAMCVARRQSSLCSKMVYKRTTEDSFNSLRRWRHAAVLVGRILTLTFLIVFPLSCSLGYDHIAYWYHPMTVPDAIQIDVQRRHNPSRGDWIVYYSIPKTNYSLTDLDQLVAATAGGIVLAFSLYQFLPEWRGQISLGAPGP